MRPRPAASPFPLARQLLALVCLYACLLVPGASASELNFTGKSLVDIFWQLEYVDTPTNGNPHTGGQNFTTCCLKAVQQAVEVGPTGHLQFASQFENWIMFDEGADQPLDLLYNYSARSQFPCTAVYNSDSRGAPVVRVNYTWLADNCPGWELSSKDNLNAWLQPLSGFLIPAVIFCLSIPRRRKLEVPRFLFAPDQSGIKNYILAPFGALLALLMVSIDTLVWLCICFAFSGPMILSGLYEAMLDNRLIEFLRFKVGESRLTLDMRCRCLMIILIGNLDLAWNTDDPTGNGGFVDGNAHSGMHVGDRNFDEYDGGDGGQGYDSRHGRTNSGDMPLMPLRQGQEYQPILGGEQGSPLPAGAAQQGAYVQVGQHAPDESGGAYMSSYASSPFAAGPSATGAPYASGVPRRRPVGQASPTPSGASLSPGSPVPVLLAGSAAAPLMGAYLPPPQTPPAQHAGLVSDYSLQNPAVDHWNHPDDGGGQYGNIGGGAGYATMPPTVPPAPVASGYPQAQAAVPGLYFSPASAGPDPGPSFSTSNLAASQQPQFIGRVSGFPPGHPGPSGQFDNGAYAAAPATPAAGPAMPGYLPNPSAIGGGGAPLADSGFVAAGVMAAGVGVGISHDANRKMLLNHRNRGPVASPWEHMEEFLYELRLYDDEFPLRKHSPRQYAKHQSQLCPAGDVCNDARHAERPIMRTRDTERLIHQTKTRLKTMLHCQYSFGSVVGAPVIFFLGGFIFALLQSLDTLGDESIAEGLAFGQWYMTIPHISIVSGLLLAGNNPNILEGVLAVERKYRHDNITLFGITYGLSYPSCYKVASLWDRGYNKKQWLNTLIATYLLRYDPAYGDSTVKDGLDKCDKDIVDLKKATTLSLVDWVFLLCLTLLLLGLPYILAFLTAYFTPEIGLSCRSLTFTVYLLVQICQILLWLWAYAGPLSVFTVQNPGLFQSGGWLYKRGFYQPYSLSWLVGRGEAVPRNPFKLLRLVWNNPQRLTNWRFIWNLIYFPSQWLLGLIGIMSAIGGTAMQLMGVYSADICYITTNHWFSPLEQRPMAVISVNSAEMIREAEIMWKPCAITAIVFMSAVSFVGWWYQRRMRDLFAEQVQKIDENERLDTQASCPVDRRVQPHAASDGRLLNRGQTPSINFNAHYAGQSVQANYAVSTGYNGYYGSIPATGDHRYGSLGAQSGTPMMSSALSGVGTPPLASQGAAGPGRRAYGSLGESSGGRTPSPMGPSGGIGSIPEDSNLGVVHPDGGSVSGPSGVVSGTVVNPGLTVGVAGPSRRTPFQRTPSPNTPPVDVGQEQF